MLVLDKQLKNKKRSMEDIEEAYDNYSYLQSNLTEKLLRVFRRIGYHHSSVMVDSYPYVVGSNLGLTILDVDDVCNNKLLRETYNFHEARDRRNLK